MRGGDTIVALSSGGLPSGVAIIRLSGPLSGDLLREFTGVVPMPRRLTLARICDGDEVVDQGLVAWFPRPHSFTGEDCVELQVHGSPAVVRRLLRILTQRPGARLAEAGEFTRRAFESGRLDLTEVEGLGDLIGAETENQRRQAAARLEGGLSRQIAKWREGLLDARAEIEARLDFADESDVNVELPVSVVQSIGDLRSDMQAALALLEHGRIAREGLRVALAGPPNAGKSSLLNALVRSDVAIVTDEPGTTRDVREVALDLGGQLVVLVDMAGLRDTESKAEAEGVRRARNAISEADLVLWLVAPDVPEAAAEPDAGPTWRVATKSDLRPPDRSADVAVSSLTGAGVDLLLARLRSFADQYQLDGEPALLSRERDRAAVAAAVGALSGAEGETELELVAEQLRQASDQLRRLTGELDAEAVLDRLFAAFCIGK